MLESLLELIVPIPLDSLFDPTPRESFILGLWATALGLELGLLAAWIAGYVALLVWVARDAMARGMDGSILWMLMVLISGPVGLMVYVVSRPEGHLARCATCGSRRLAARLRCPHCDARRPAPEHRPADYPGTVDMGELVVA